LTRLWKLLPLDKMSRKLFLTLSGGLGNQLHTLAAGYVLSKLNNRNLVLLLPQTSAPDSLRKNEKDVTAFDIHDLPDVAVSTLSRKGGAKQRLKRVILRGVSATSKRLFSRVHLRTKDINTESHDLEITIQDPLFMEDHYENAYFPARARELSFPAKLNLVTKSREFLDLEQSIKNPSRRTIIGVHIRLGDFRTWNGGSQLLETSYYLENLRSISRQFPNSQVWVFSDEPEEAATMLGSEFELKEISKDYDLSNAEELVLLSRTDAILASRSTFSWWACFWKEGQSNIWYPDTALCLAGWTYSLRTYGAT
jgi:hypothetical protein